MNNKQQGFTLIELVMVIVILGILAATALPRFANMQTDARVASLKGALGALNSAIAIVHAQALVKGSTASVDLESGSVALTNGYPAATKAAIEAAVKLSDDFTVALSGTDVTITPAGAATPASCKITYSAASSSTPAPTVVIVTTGC